MTEEPHPDQRTISLMLQSAKEQLIVRQKELSFTLPAPPIITPAPPPQAPVISHQKMQQMMDLQARIQKSLAGSTLLSGLLNGDGNMLTVRPPVGGVIMNEQGRTVTAEGKAIELTPNQPTLKANIVNKQRTQQFKQPSDKPSLFV